VDGTHISESQLLRELHALGGNAAFVSTFDRDVASSATQGQAPQQPVFTTDTAEPSFTSGFAANVLSGEVQAAVVHAADVRLHIEPSAAQIAAAKTAVAAEVSSDPAVFGLFQPWFQHTLEVRFAETAELGQRLAGNPALVQAFYRDNPQYFITAECVSQILVGSEDEARSLRGQIAGGAKFADLAKKYSTDTASASKGGSMGCTGLGTFAVPTFSYAASTLPVGQLSQPIHSQFGWHLIEVNSRQLQALDAQTQTGLTNTLKQDPYFTVLAGVPVTINPTYGTWDALQLAVTPPVPPGPNSGALTPTTAAGAVPLTPSGGSSSSP